MRAPSARPGGTLIVSGSVRISTCWPPHVGQRVCRWRPDPPQCAHGFGEHHVPARRLDDAGAVAVRAAALGDVEPTQALARAAMLLTRDGQLALAAAHRLFEGERHRLDERSAPRSGAALGPPRVALVQDVGEQIAEGRRGLAPLALTEKSKPSNPNVDSSPTVRRAEPTDVVAAAPIGIAERLVRLGDLTELGRRHPVARVDVRVIPAREPLVRALDVAKRRVAIEAEDDVEVHEWVEIHAE